MTTPDEITMIPSIEEIPTESRIGREDALRFSRLFDTMPYSGGIDLRRFEFGRPRGEELLEEFDLEVVFENMRRLRDALRHYAESNTRQEFRANAIDRDLAAVRRVFGGTHDYALEYERAMGRID